MTDFAFLHFGGAGTVDHATGPMLTLRVPAKQTDLPRYGRSAMGYGARIPSSWMVQLHGRWRRVYVACWGNSGTAYVGKAGAWLCTVDIDTA